MFKRLALKKLLIVSLSFVILLLLYLFPNNDNYHIKTTLTYIEKDTIPIYLIDGNN